MKALTFKELYDAPGPVRDVYVHCVINKCPIVEGHLQKLMVEYPEYFDEEIAARNAYNNLSEYEKEKRAREFYSKMMLGVDYGPSILEIINKEINGKSV